MSMWTAVGGPYCTPHSRICFFFSCWGYHYTFGDCPSMIPYTLVLITSLPTLPHSSQIFYPMTTQSLTMLYQKIQGFNLPNKMTKASHYLKSHNIEIVFLQETRLCSIPLPKYLSSRHPSYYMFSPQNRVWTVFIIFHHNYPFCAPRRSLIKQVPFLTVKLLWS